MREVTVQTILKTVFRLVCLSSICLMSVFAFAGCKSNSAPTNAAPATGTNAAGQPTSHQSSMVNRVRHKPGAAGSGQ